MAYILFVDESGHDRRESPNQVLAGVAVKEADVWELITSLQGLEKEHFGGRISQSSRELKAKKLIKRKVFRHAKQLPEFPDSLRADLARQCLDEGAHAKAEGRTAVVTKQQLTALAQAKIAFVNDVLELCKKKKVKAFASIVKSSAERPGSSFLRKDYAYLFERFYYFLEKVPRYHQGIVVFDELDKSQSHILTEQMAEYFKNTAKGRLRASRVIPEPFFVHSDLTTMIQVADLVAYICAWGVRVGKMPKPARDELVPLGRLVSDLRFKARRRQGQRTYDVWSFAVISDLRPRGEKQRK